MDDEPDDLFRPLTAEKAWEEAEPVHLTEDRIKEIVEYATRRRAEETDQ